MKQWTPEEIWECYKGDTFLETGTFQGKGVQRALDVGHKKAISVEIHFDRYKNCKERFEEELDNSFDPYQYIKDSYIQNRKYKIYNGDIAEDDEELDFDFDDF